MLLAAALRDDDVFGYVAPDASLPWQFVFRPHYVRGSLTPERDLQRQQVAPSGYARRTPSFGSRVIARMNTASKPTPALR